MYEFEIHLEVFDKLRDPIWVTSVMPGLIENTNIRRVPVQEGDSFDYAYQIFGVILHGKWYVDFIDRPNTYKAHTVGEGLSSWEYQLSGNDNGTMIRMTIRYDMPEGVIGKVKTVFLKKVNYSEAKHYMHNLKLYFELAN
jgi:hypothetical protein